MFSKFLLGALVVEEDVVQTLERMPLDLIARHAVCDHGTVSGRQVKANEIAMDGGGEIRSEYLIDPRHPEHGRITVVTVAGWDQTKVCIKRQPKEPKRRKSR